jgi:hypothetical protein
VDLNVKTFVEQSLQSIRQADSEAEQAQLAFALQDFDSYFARKVAAARSRLEERYRELERAESQGGSPGADGGVVTAGVPATGDSG